VNEDVTREHYARLAATYDQNWAHSPEFIAWMTRCIQQRLRITGTDQVIDVGCGTGLYSRELALDAASVVCADPSAPMLAQLPHDGRLIAVNASAEDLASGRVRLPAGNYDAMLLKEVLHHVGDQGQVIGGLARLLKPGGRMLVVMLPATISYPLFGAALELFTRQQPDPAGIVARMRAAGLEAELDYEGFPLVFPVERYLQMVRDRYMSLLSHFSDAELEAGAGEIRRAHPGDEISFEDRFAFVTGVKA
jgi:ubiquinone/menaquinone biosynthesis C-methylase UbiE